MCNVRGRVERPPANRRGRARRRRRAGAGADRREASGALWAARPGDVLLITSDRNDQLLGFGDEPRIWNDTNAAVDAGQGLGWSRYESARAIFSTSPPPATGRRRTVLGS